MQFRDRLSNVQRHPPASLKVFFLVSIVLDVIGVFCASVGHFVLHLRYPYGTPLLEESWGVDLSNYREIFQHLHTVEFFSQSRPIVFEYPAPVALIYGFFLSFCRPVVFLESVLLLLVIGAAIWFGLQLKKLGVATVQSVLVAAGAVILSYPLAFELKQGNTELFVAALAAVGIWKVLRGSEHTGAALIGIAGAMKLYPFIFLGIFLSVRRYRPLMTAFVAAVIVTIGALVYVGPTVPIAWHGVQAGVAHFQSRVALQIMTQTGYDHCLFMLVKRAVEFFHHAHGAFVSPRILRIYLLIVGSAGVVLFFTRIRKLPLLNQVLCLCVASIMLPPVSCDYTLLHLYLPWALLAVFAIKTFPLKTPGLSAAMALLAIETSDEVWLIVHGQSIAGLIKLAALCALFFVALKYPFEDGRSAEHSEVVETFA